jgi:hypothetical protein
MATPAIQTLMTDAQQVLNLKSVSEIHATLAAVLANANVGTPLNPNLTTQQLWDEFYEIVRQTPTDIESIIVNQMMKFVFSPPAPGGVGADGQVIFNDGGVLAGDPQFLWNKTTNLLTVTGSATITGDLTVDTNVLKVDTTNNRVGINIATPAQSLDIASGNLQVRTGGTVFSDTFSNYGAALAINAAGSLPIRLQIAGTNAYEITSANVHTWSNVGGVAGTAMTLNSTGLGVGMSPLTDRLTIFGSAGVNVSGGFADISFRNSPGTAIQRIRYTDGSGTLTIGSPLGTSYPVELGGNTTTRAVTIDASSNVGIGVTPSAWKANHKALQFGPFSTGYGSIYTDDSGNTWFNSLNFQSATTRQYITTGNAAAYRLTAAGQHQWYTDSVGGVAGGTVSFTQAMTLDASGNLLVGTTTPLQISNNPAVTSRISNLGTGSKGAMILRENEASAFWGGNLYLQKVRGTSTAVQSGDALGLVAFGGFDGTNYVNTAVIQTSVTGAVSAGVVPVKIQVVATSGGVELTNTATSWAAISDERLKDIIEPINNAVSKVGLLRSVIGKYKCDSEGTRRSFLIAQDVQSALPEAVGGNEDSMTVRYTEVIPLLVAAIKELTARVQTLEAK